MRLRSVGQVVALWMTMIVVFLLTAWASGALLPKVPVTRPPLSYYVGLVGLLGIGLALALTWEWVGRAGPRSVAMRAIVRFALLVLAAAWALAMIFPFL